MVIQIQGKSNLAVGIHKIEDQFSENNTVKRSKTRTKHSIKKRLFEVIRELYLQTLKHFKKGKEAKKYDRETSI